MSVDELIDQLSSLTLRAGQTPHGTSKKLQYKEEGKEKTPTATFELVSPHHRRGGSLDPS